MTTWRDQEEKERQNQAEDYNRAMDAYGGTVREDDNGWQDFLDKVTQGGWYASTPNAAYTGKPSTLEEKGFIENFVREFGTTPTSEQVRTGMGGNYGTTYNPDTIMGEMGFENEAQYRAAQNEGLTYGPNMAKLVPFGGTVALDEKGQPLNRFFGKTPPGARVLAPPGGTGGPEDFMSGDLGYAKLQKQAYGTSAFTPPTRQQAFEKVDPYKLYQSMFADYTGRKQDEYYQTQRELEAINSQFDEKGNLKPGAFSTDIQNRLSSGSLTAEQATKIVEDYKSQLQSRKDELDKAATNNLTPQDLISYQNQANMILKSVGKGGLLGLEDLPFYGQMYADSLSNLLGESVQAGQLTPEQADGIADEAERLSKQGKPFADLPLFDEVMGQYTQKYLDQLQGETEQEARKEWAGKFLYEQRPPTEKGGPTGNEKREYYGYIQNFPQNQQQWFAQNYSYLYGFWINTRPDIPFMDWLPGYLAGIPPEEPAPVEQPRPDPYAAARLAPRTRSLNW